MSNKWIVDEESELLKYLYDMMPSRGRNSVKSILRRGQVIINGRTSTQFDDILTPGDVVEIYTQVATSNIRITGITIIHEDSDIVVIEKAAGLLSVASTAEKRSTAYEQVLSYVQSQNPKNEVFVVHRLDRDTSGVMIFAKSKDVQLGLQANWNEIVSERSYIALVEGIVKEDGTVVSWLTENKAFHVYSSPKYNGGKKAITHYKVLKTNKQMSLLQINLDTGRKNQIRVQMQDINHPIVNDKKYGATTNPLRRLGLHANAIEFIHPKTRKPVRYESQIPQVFLNPFNKN